MTDFASRDPTVVAAGTSVMWATGNAYENKFPNLVHKDLTGDYPIDEKYLHWAVGRGPPGKRSDPTPSYYEQTKSDHDVTNYHPNGDPLPPKQYRARGGAIIGLSPPAPVEFGNQSLSDRPHTDGGNYLADNANGSYYGKLDHTSSYSGTFNQNALNRSRWLIARDIGWGWPTIANQLEQFRGTGTVDVPTGSLSRFGGKPDDDPPAREDVDVLLLDGGTNDLTLGWLNNPTKSGRETIWKACRLYLYRNMTGTNMPGEKGLLWRAREVFPNAVIVLLGYPVWASNRTDRKRAKGFLVDQEPAARALPGAVEQAVDNALNFAHFQAYWLRRAVAEANRADDGPGIVMAPPGYGVVNAMMTDWPWSFGYDPNAGASVPGSNATIGLTDDDVTSQRVNVCRSEIRAEKCIGSYSCDPKNRDEEVDLVNCYAAPIGHPNAEGCRQYADTIVRRYKTHIHRSLSRLSEELDPGTDSLRRSLDRYDFDLAGEGVKYATSHDVVDAMRVRINTKSGLGSGRARGEIYLRVYPGRNGSGERFRLDSENSDTNPGGPSSRPRDEFHVDPMMSRRLSGPPGNVDDGEGIGRGRNEETIQTYHAGDHWSDRRLRLGDVRHAALELRNVDPNNGWDIADVDLSINGHITRTRTFDDLDQRDLRSDSSSDPFRWQEFLLASFNHVDGVGPGDLSVSLSGISASGGSNQVTVTVDVEITNNASKRIPSVGLQTGLRVRTGPNADYDGLDWQVRPTSDVAPGETITPRIRLRTDETGKFGGIGSGNNRIEVAAFYHVGGDIGRTTASKAVSNL